MHSTRRCTAGDTEQEKPETITTRPTPVVGIGASAGGLEALRELVGQLPGDTGFAYVVVVHLSPERESYLPDILQRSAAITVVPVKERVELEPNTMYVVSPGKQLSIVDGHVGVADVSELRWRRAPINRLLSTLGQSHSDGIGIILSGGGSDGSGGLRSLKEHGGIVFAQDPDEAQYSAMPRNAIATGLVDFVLPVREIARKLVVLSRGREPTLPLGTDNHESVDRILHHLHTRTGHDFSGYKRPTLMRRIQRRMRVNQAHDLGGYASIVERDESEAQALLRDLLISVTGFFRDAEAWRDVAQMVIPKLFEGKADVDTVRVWVPGCATGEEAYGIAMLLIEHAATLDTHPNFQVFASDMDEDALAVAREGLYAASVVDDLGIERIERFFTREGYGYRIQKHVREQILFTVHNVLRDPPFSKLDFVSCRNVLIYLRRDLQERVLEVFAYALNPGGFLLLGGSETADAIGDLFRTVRKRQRIYQRRRTLEGTDRMPELPLQIGRVSGRPPPVDRAVLQGRHTVADLDLHRRALERFGPPSLLVTENHEVLHLSDNAGKFLRQPGGPPSHQLFRLVPKDIRFELRLALDKAFAEGLATALPPRVLEIDGARRYVATTVNAVGHDDGERLALVTFTDSDLPAEAEVGPDGTSDPLVATLESELEATRDRLQAAIEDNDATQEETKAANEELQSINEEYKSTLEELETSKEELQSVNEELHTVNEELHHKVEETTRVNSDLRNLIESADAGVIFLDLDLKIARFTQQVARVFNLIPRDRGRPLAHVTSRFLDQGKIGEAAARVLRDHEVVELELAIQGGETAFVRIRPYFSESNTVEGIVVTIVDVTPLARAKEDLLQSRSALEQSEHRLRLLADTLEQRVTERTRELLERTRQVRRLATDLVFAEQRERHLLAQVLHDDLQQILYAVQMKIALLLRQAEPLHNEGWTAGLEEAHRLLAGAVDKTRRLSVDLSPPILRDEGLTEAIAWLTRQLAELYGTEVDVESTVGNEGLSQEMRVLVYQIVRELLFNVVKHAKVDRAKLRLERTDDTLTVRVKDEGVGFDPNTLHPRSSPLGFGLPSLRERVQFFGGRMDIASSVGRGTRVTFSVPTSWHDEPAPNVPGGEA